MNLRKSIKLALVQQDKTNLWLAEQLGTSPAYTSRLQRHGSSASFKQTERIAEIFGMTLSEFIALGEE
ncbi:MAG: hypothetical protein ACN2B6_00060 [Rickettsiales bacterium]